MNFNQSFCKLTDDIGRAIIKRSPELLAGSGIACFLASTVLAVKATPAAAKKLEKKKEELNVEKLPIKETVQTVWKDYLPAALSSVGGVCFITASVSTSNKRYMALGTSYGLLKDFAYTYREKVIETIGEKKDEKIRNEIQQEKMDRDKIDESKIIINGNGTTLFKDSLTGQYFRMDINKFKQKALELANDELNENYVGVPDWLLELGLNIPETMMGLGWSITDQGKAVTVDFTACQARQYNDEPCLVVEYSPMPISDFDIFYK